MAFFGLTQLGEQQYFRDNSSAHGVNLTLFVEADVRDAFRRTVLGRRRPKKNQSIPTSIKLEKIQEFLRNLYEGPLIGLDDERLISEALGNPSPDMDIHEDDFVEAVLNAREETKQICEAKEYTAVEHHSFGELKEANLRNERLKYAPREKFVLPVSSAQDYGWNIGRTKFAQLDKQISRSYPKRASAETAFADAMAAAGNL